MRPMQLNLLHERLQEAGLVLQRKGYTGTAEISHLASDSRRVEGGGLFVAVRGEQSDGHRFIEQAVSKGASAVVCEEIPKTTEGFAGVDFIQVSNTRQALAELAAAFYGDPAHKLSMVGITGTNGKTTTAFLVHHMLTVLGVKTGLLGTVATRVGEETLETSLTTPDALTLHRMLKDMVEAGCTACTMEVSSHALVQERTHGVPFEVAVFTNLTQDHLDYHGSFNRYLDAKKKLFDELGTEAVALYNLDDESGAQMVADTAAQRRSYGQKEEADFRIEGIENRLEGLRMRIDRREHSFYLVGLFNAYNLAAAYGVGRALGYNGEEVLEALSTAPPVPGRFEQFRFEGDRTVIVDYAHTPDALENVLQTIQAFKPAGSRLWCVFGCGGDRDRAKRRLMGSLAEHYADGVIVTSDNPRTEDPASIMNDIRRGMNRPVEARWIVDRREAIREAAAVAQPGDVVLVAGKGHETYQIVGKKRLPFDDRAEVKKNFKLRRLDNA